MKTITITFSDNDYVFQYNDDLTDIKLYNEYFRGFFPFVRVPISNGQFLGKASVLLAIQAELRKK